MTEYVTNYVQSIPNESLPERLEVNITAKLDQKMFKKHMWSCAHLACPHIWFVFEQNYAHMIEAFSTFILRSLILCDSFS